MARDVTKLPQWAQEKIINLEARVRVLQASLDSGVIGSEFPRDNLHLVSENGAMDWLPSRYHYGRFMLGSSWDAYVDFRMDDRAEGKTVSVTAGFSRLIVLPEAGNSVRIGIKR